MGPSPFAPHGRRDQSPEERGPPQVDQVPGPPQSAPKTGPTGAHAAPPDRAARPPAIHPGHDLGTPARTPGPRKSRQFSLMAVFSADSEKRHNSARYSPQKFFQPPRIFAIMTCVFPTKVFSSEKFPRHNDLRAPGKVFSDAAKTRHNDVRAPQHVPFFQRKIHRDIMTCVLPRNYCVSAGNVLS